MSYRIIPSVFVGAEAWYLRHYDGSFFNAFTGDAIFVGPTVFSERLMRGKTIVITGGTSGIGEVAAVALAKMGARIVLVARDKSRGDATLARLRDNAPSIAHSVYFADLLRLAEMKRVAAEITDRETRIDVLINNAGALFAKRRLTEDGLERTFALNHMAYFIMTAGSF